MPQKKSLQEQLALYIGSCFPILYLETFEEKKAEALIRKAAGISADNSRKREREFVEWNVHGLFFHRLKKRDKVGLAEVLDRFTHPEFLSSDEAKERYFPSRKLLFIKDADVLLEQPEITARLKNLAEKILHDEKVVHFSLVIVGPVLPVPKTLEHFIAIHQLEPLNEVAIKKVIEEFYEEIWKESHSSEEDLVPLDKGLLRDFTLAFKGLPEFEIRTILSLIYADIGSLQRSDIAIIQEQKRQMVQKSGILEMVNVRETVDDIGGLEHLKCSPCQGQF